LQSDQTLIRIAVESTTMQMVEVSVSGTGTEQALKPLEAKLLHQAGYADTWEWDIETFTVSVEAENAEEAVRRVEGSLPAGGHFAVRAITDS